MPIAAITGTLDTGVCSLSDRLRVEDLIGVPGNPWRYQNLVSIFSSPRGSMIAVADRQVFSDEPSQLLRLGPDGKLVLLEAAGDLGLH